MAEPEEALRLAFHAQAELHSRDNEGLVRSVLLATESLRRVPTAGAIETLQGGLDLLPRRVCQWPDGSSLSLVSHDDTRAVLRMLTNETYCGVWHYRKRRRDRGEWVSQRQHQPLAGFCSLHRVGRALGSRPGPLG